MNTKYAKKATLYINPAVHKLLKIKAAVADETISDVVNDILGTYFTTNERSLIKQFKTYRKRFNKKPTNEEALLSEKALSDWLRPEEDEAWKDLQ